MILLLFREFVDSKTVFGYYISFSAYFAASLMYFVIFAVSIGFFISLSIYVNAISEDFKTIISEMNEKVIREKSSKSRAHMNPSFSKLLEAVSVHNEMFKYLSIGFQRIRQ